MSSRIIVIGGTAAGPSAASKAKRVNPDADVVLYEAGRYISYGVCEMPYYLSGEIRDPDDLIVYTPERLKREKGVSAFTHHYVESIRPSRKEITIKDFNSGKIITDQYDKLIIATGCRPKRLNLQGSDARNVFYIKELDTTYALKKYIDEEHPRSAVILGAGFIGLEMTESLVQLGIDVTLIHQSFAPMSMMDDGNRKSIRSIIEKNNVRFIPNSKIEWLGIGQKNNVVAVGTKNETIETDLVIVAIGVEPNADLAVRAGIKTGRYGGIVTNEKMNVSGSENIYAAGDCCELKNIVTGKLFYQSLATTASKTGWIAGENAAGGRAKFKGAVRAIGLRFFDHEIAQVGLGVREAEESGYTVVASTVHAALQPGMMPGNEQMTVTMLADKNSGRVIGVSMVGGKGTILRANIYAAAIKHRMTADDISDLDLVYTPPVSPLWDGVILSGRHIKKSL